MLPLPPFEVWLADLARHPEAHFDSFTGPALHDSHLTAPVFRERSAEALRDRFMDFEATSLEAFLRSCLA